jgi:starch phosphorylase
MTECSEKDPSGTVGIELLQQLALDLFWSWNHSADQLWGRIDPELWQLTHNPWVVLQTVSRRKLAALLGDPEFCARITALIAKRRERFEAASWFQQAYPDAPLSTIACFSMEYMLSEALPIYSGGLGNVAGDNLKASSDLGVPVVGIGLLYAQGYFRQVIDAVGHQRALHPYNDPTQLPITPVRTADGEWLRLRGELPGRSLWLRVWQALIGQTRLYLLDSNDPANDPVERGVTSELYGGGPELRLAQEILLGIGGWRLLEALGIDTQVCHLNEGHAAFTVLERARSFMHAHGCSFAEALAVTRVGNVFTTHTPVAAGFDRFDPALVIRYLGRYASEQLGITPDALLALGRGDPGNPAEPFNMAFLALRGSGAVNGVSRLHGAVSREIFQPLFPHWPRAEVPIGHVTNGVHMPSWDSRGADKLWTHCCGQDRWRGALENVPDTIMAATDVEIWQMRSAARVDLVHYARQRLGQQLAAEVASESEIAKAEEVLDANALTLGFARRFTAYKRPNLLLHDPERLARILTNSARPVQLIIAGKAHPQDSEGVAMVAQWVQFVRGHPEVRRRAVFLSDYDMLLSEQLVQGVDVWINTPRRPWEASGTSGMKVLVNGGLNLSELDGWWAEAYSPDVGWAIGDGAEHDADPAWDAYEADCLYRILEQEVVLEFYARDPEGIPRAWVNRVRASMARLTPRFSANRTVREYTEHYYLPAAEAYRRRAAEGGALGRQLVAWESALATHWHNLHIAQSNVETSGDRHRVTLHVYLDELDPDMVQVQLYAEAFGDYPVVVEPLQRGAALPGAVSSFVYAGEVAAARPAAHFTPRIVPFHPAARVPLEASQVLWGTALAPAR